jgi:hypothetical protein
MLISQGGTFGRALQLSRFAQAPARGYREGFSYYRYCGTTTGNSGPVGILSVQEGGDRIAFKS